MLCLHCACCWISIVAAADSKKMQEEVIVYGLLNTRLVLAHVPPQYLCV